MSDTLFSQGTVITSPWLNDANTSTYNLLTNIHGTGNDITATGPMSLTVGYPTGVFFSLIPTAANTGPATLNISGLGVKPLLEQGDSTTGLTRTTLRRMLPLTYCTTGRSFSC